jgi:copper resistance protein B
LRSTAIRAVCSLVLSGSTLTAAAITTAPAGAADAAAMPPDARQDSAPLTAPSMMPGMDMDDDAIHHLLWIETLEAVTGTATGGAWDTQAWLGGDFDKLWLKSEGEHVADRTETAKLEVLEAHALLPFWDLQAGLRQDFGHGPQREWAAFGVQGIAPYWFDVELTGYVGEEERTAARLKSENDLYITQRLVLKPEIELNVYGRPDRARALGAGLANGQFALRLRYEFTRRFAPYLGYVYARQFAGSALLTREADEPALEHRVVLGIALLL